MFRRVVVVLASVFLVVVFAAMPATARTSRLVDAHALVALEGVPVGWIDAHLTTQTDTDPTPGMVEFTPLPGSGEVAWQAIAKRADFYWSDYDPELDGSPPGASLLTDMCRFWGPGDYACEDVQIWLLDGTTFGGDDWLVTAPEDDTVPDWHQTWYRVVTGTVEVQRPGR